MRVLGWLWLSGWALAQAATPAGVPRFEPNRGQSGSGVKFLGRIGSQRIAFGAATVQIGSLRLHFRNANPAPGISGEDLLPSRSFYYTGIDPARWEKDVPNYARLRYRGLYPGIDCVFYGAPSGGSALEYDLMVAPHADPAQAVLEIEGADSLALNAWGDLQIRAGERVLVQRKPRAFQEGREIAGRYRIDGMRVSYALAQYNPSDSLLIDPVLDYASYFGGNLSDTLTAIVSDASGNVYVTGQTQPSTNFPPSPLAGETAEGGLDVILTKFDSTGKTVLFTAILGSSGNDSARNIAVDAAGNVYLVGQAGGPNFPVMNAYQPSVGNADQSPNGFVAKLNSSGSLIFSTYLGGKVSPPINGGTTLNTTTAIQTVVPDKNGNVWVGGWTFATDFPSTLGPAPDPANYPYVFVTGFTATGGLVQSMTFSYAYNDISLVTAVAPDGAGNVVVAASTTGNLQTTPGVVQPAFDGGPADVFVAKLNPAGTSANYITALTYLGGSGLDELDAMVLDSSGNAYVTGSTASIDFPVTKGAMQGKLAGVSGGFVAKLNPALTAIEFSTYFGGVNGSEVDPRDVRLDAAGNIFIAGQTDFADLTPASLGSNTGAVQPLYGGNTDGFVMELNPTASQAEYFTYFGGSATDYIFGMTLDAAGNLYAAGTTSSTNLPVTNAYQPAIATPPDGFFLRLSFANPNAVAISSVNVAGFGSAALAQNTWIEIHGLNFAPTGTAATWSTAPDFAMGRMPVELSGVSVTVNGKAAFLYYVSPTQVNVLTPLDSTTGPVQIVLTSGSASASLIATLQTVSPSFLLFGATRYIAATHANGSLLGPSSMSVPGYTFTPAQPGEIIVLYGVGFGLPAASSQLINGSSSQSGDLPVLPVIQIGGVSANVTFAGVVSPGLYQFDVQIPPGAANGDLSVQTTYGGSSTPAGDLITVHN
jgi:uncharacterized protein (TIGR03437 family)